jgi:hypothetical protein
MGNYIYGYITPLGKSNQSIKNNTTEANKTEVKIANEKIVATVEETDEKSIHPYLIEYGTVMYDSIMINNTAYKYKKLTK